MDNSATNTIHFHIYEKLIKLIPEFWLLEPEERLISYATKPMSRDLHLNILSRNQEEMTIALSHYYQSQSEDFVPNPSMQVRIFLKYNLAEALTYQDEFINQRIYFDESHSCSRQKKEFNSCLNYWLSDCLEGGHRLQREKEEKSNELK